MTCVHCYLSNARLCCHSCLDIFNPPVARIVLPLIIPPPLPTSTHQKQANCCLTAVRRGHAGLVWLRPVLLLCGCVYVFNVYSGMALYLSPEGGSLFPPIYMRSLIWCDMMAAALTGLALVMEVQQVGDREGAVGA